MDRATFEIKILTLSAASRVQADLEIVAPVAIDGVCTSIVDRQANRFVPEIQLQSICSGDVTRMGRKSQQEASVLPNYDLCG